MQLNAHGSLANVLWLKGDFIGSRVHSEKGISLFDREDRLGPGEEHLSAASQVGLRFELCFECLLVV